MATLVRASAPLSEISRRVIRLQVMTIAWMTVEAVRLAWYGLALT